MNLNYIAIRVEGKRVNFKVNKIINAGRSSRSFYLVKKHRDELIKSGIKVGEEFPIFWPKTPERITTNNFVNVLPESKTSGEIEYVLLIDKDRIYVTVGSDHTDRELQKTNPTQAKEIYNNIMAPECWNYDNVKSYWDELIIQSWVERNGKEKIYQSGKLKEIINPEKIIEKVKLHITDNLVGSVIYSGTLPTIEGKIIYSSLFKMKLIDNKRKKTIQHEYRVRPIKWFI